MALLGGLFKNKGGSTGNAGVSIPRPVRHGGGKPLPFENLYIYGLMGLIGFLAADLTLIAFRDKMLPTAAPPARKQHYEAPPRPGRSDYDNVLARNIFNSDGVIPDPVSKKADEKKKEEDNIPVLSQLPMQLVGTLVHVNPARAIAAIEIKSSQKVLAFVPNDDIEGLATLVKVERLRAIFRNNNTRRLEYIEIKDNVALAKKREKKPETTDAVSGSGTEFTVKRAELNKMLDNLPEILQQARAVPNIVPGSGGKVDGFKVLDIAPGSIYEKLGIQRMDIIKGVNGEDVDSPAKAMELYNKLKSEGRVQLEVERGGRKEVLNYNID